MSLLAGVALAGFARGENDASLDKLGKKIEPTLVDVAGKRTPLAGLKGVWTFARSRYCWVTANWKSRSGT